MKINDIRDVRRLNIQYLASTYKSRMDFASALGYSDISYLSQLINGHSEIGNNTARKINQALALGENWMDTPHPDKWEIIGVSMVDTMTDLAKGMADSEIVELIQRLASQLSKSK